MNKYWMIHNPIGRAPFHTHTSRRLAKVEAEDLAIKNPGQLFVVLETVEACVFEQPVRWINVDDEIPD